MLNTVIQLLGPNDRKQQIFTRKTKKVGTKKVEQSNTKDTMRRNKSAYANSPVADFSVIHTYTLGMGGGKKAQNVSELQMLKE